MNTLEYKVIPEGMIGDILIPLNIVLVDEKDVARAGLGRHEAIHEIARSIDGACGINIFDMDAVTTTSDGIMARGAIVCMGAADRGKVNPDFGILDMAEMPYSDRLVGEEPHLVQWKKRYPGTRLFRGPDPSTKIIPVHNVVISGRASNNNSATEMMNIITMEEILLPILGQLACMNGDDVLLGRTGEVISVGIGMTVAEQFGRVFPTRQFRAGETAHGSGEYAKTLKKNIPCMVAGKAILARHILNALEDGCIPGRSIGCSPAVLTVAKYTGAEMDLENITARAWEELESVGMQREWLRSDVERLTQTELIGRANELIPGLEGAEPYRADEIVQVREISVG